MGYGVINLSSSFGGPVSEAIVFPTVNVLEVTLDSVRRLTLKVLILEPISVLTEVPRQ